MGEMLLNGRLYGASGIRELTQSQYDALPSSKLTDGVLYCIKDAGIVEGDKYAPVIYSLEEREIGTYVDGKPLYEKSYEGTTSGTTNPTILDSNIKSDSGIYQVKNISGIWSIGAFGYSTATIQELDTEGTFSVGSMNAYCRVTPNGLCFYRGNVNWGAQYRITVQYTKTTDIPGSGTWGTDGVPMVHYDGNEKIIGTWFGETLYEKTIILTNITFGSYQYIQLSDISTTLKDVTYLQGAIRRSNYNYDILDNTTGSTPCVRSNGIEYKVDSVFSPNFQQLEFIVRYTKTS